MKDLEKSKEQLIKEIQKLRKQQKQFRAFADNAQDMFYRMSLPDGKYEYISSASERIFGYTPSELYENPKLIEKIIAPDFKDYFKHQWGNLANGKMPPFYEYKIIHKSGEERWVNQRNTLIKNKKGKTIAIEGIVTDITERKKIEDALKKSQEQYRSLIDNALVGIYQTSLKGELVYGNEAALKMFEFDSLDEAIKEGVLKRYKDPEVRKKFLETINKDGKVSNFEAEMITKNGKVRNMLTSGSIDGEHLSGMIIDITDQKESEKALRESEEKYRFLVENINDALFSTDEKGSITYLSPVIQSFTGYEPSEIIGKSFMEFIHENDLSKIMTSFEEILSNRLHPTKYRIKNKKGGYCWVRSSSRPVIIDCEVKGIQGVITNITREKEAEQKQKETEFQLHNIIGNIPDTIVEMDENGKFNYVSPQVEEMFGYEPAEVMGKIAFDFLHQDDLEKVLTAMEEALKEKKPVTLEYRIRHKNGGYVHVSVKGSMIEKNGEVTLAGVIRDVTAQKKAEEALKQSEEKFRKVFENANEGIIYMDSTGAIVDANPKVQEVTTYDRNELVGKNFMDLLPFSNIDQNKVVKIFEDMLSGKPLQKTEWNIINNKGKNIILLANPSVIKKDGEIVGFSVILDDITERKEAETKMIEERNRAELYLDILSHDINNLNQTIITANELLLLKPEFSENNRRYIQSTLEQAKVISELIMNLRKLSALQEGDFKQKNIDLRKVLTKSQNYINYAYPEAHIKINNPLLDTDIFVKGNELLQDVFDNILTNAVKYNRNENVILDISCVPEEDGKFWKLMFKDNGPGVPDSLKERIFKRFERGEEGVHGSGLGLTIAHEVVSRCGGKVWVEDRVPGETNQGSNFVVMLPKGH